MCSSERHFVVVATIHRHGRVSEDFIVFVEAVTIFQGVELHEARY